MREIRYRGKIKDAEMWAVGYYSKGLDGTTRILCNDGFVWDSQAMLSYVDVDPKTVGEYIEILDAFEGDLLYGCETDEYNTICSSWVGEVRFDESKGRMMVFDKDVDEWFEVDDFMFDKIIGNIHGVTE